MEIYSLTEYENCYRVTDADAKGMKTRKSVISTSEARYEPPSDSPHRNRSSNCVIERQKPPQTPVFMSDVSRKIAEQ